MDPSMINSLATLNMRRTSSNNTATTISTTSSQRTIRGNSSQAVYSPRPRPRIPIDREDTKLFTKIFLQIMDKEAKEGRTSGMAMFYPLSIYNFTWILRQMPNVFDFDKHPFKGYPFDTDVVVEGWKEMPAYRYLDRDPLPATISRALRDCLAEVTYVMRMPVNGAPLQVALQIQQRTTALEALLRTRQTQHLCPPQVCTEADNVAVRIEWLPGDIQSVEVLKAVRGGKVFATTIERYNPNSPAFVAAVNIVFMTVDARAAFLRSTANGFECRKTTARAFPNPLPHPALTGGWLSTSRVLIIIGPLQMWIPAIIACLERNIILGCTRFSSPTAHKHGLQAVIAFEGVYGQCDQAVRILTENKVALKIYIIEYGPDPCDRPVIVDRFPEYGSASGI